ncbi:MAG TPA: ABC transporter substrate-binding protein [Rectinemataceae bacterium]|nr:ABC transporter substrate-binding protein [Rectinemataceae bacterium]
MTPPRALVPIFLGSLLALAGCRGGSPLILGLSVALTGPTSDLGIACRDAVALAVEEANAQGGIKGRPITLVLRDDQGDPDRAVDADRALWVMGARVIIGQVTSATLPRVLAWAKDHDLLIVSPSASATSFGVDRTNLVRFTESNALQSRRLARVALADGRRKVLAVIDSSNGDYSEDFAGIFAATLGDAGGTLSATIRFRSESLLDSAARIEAEAGRADCDSALIVASAVDTGILAQFLRKVKPGLALYSSGWAFSRALLSSGGSAIEGLTLTQGFNYDDPDPAYRSFRDSYERRFGRPVDYEALFSYEAAQAVIDACRRAPDFSAASVKSALLDPRNAVGLGRKFRLDANGDITRTGYIYRVRDGAFAPAGIGQ